MSTDTPIRVLHVDDDPLYADLVAAKLGAIGAVDVRTAESAEAGLDLLASDAGFDCVVSDYDMPGTDGLEFLSAVRDRFGDLPFLLFTGHGSEDIASDAIAAGVTGYLRKRTGDSTYRRLHNRIRQAAAKHRAARDLDTERSVSALATDYLSDLFYVLDTDGTVVRWNDRGPEVTGYSDEEIEGRTAMTFVVDDDVSTVAGGLVEALDTGESRFRARLLTKAGDAIPYEFHGRRFDGPDGEPIGVCGIGRDVREQAERDRRLAEFGTMLDANPDGMFLVDGDGTVRRTNRAFGALFDMDRASLVGTPIESLLADGTLGRDAVERYRGALEELRTETAGDAHVSFRTTAAPAGGAGERVYEVRLARPAPDDGVEAGRRTAGVIRDVTGTAAGDRGR
ncbi:PAS domain-containing response regulator [Halobaculum lipolyticum]|uniref:PAS domain-containing protein n=1 Tax=Halobaculum lipolyticum TaxID=3032001 RepID=A0ABD5W8N6_9EURY|nr:PAS domain-containing protein [Halobaculum sp. DT31]